MKTIYTTYFDHINRCGFHPDLIIENWNNCDRRIVFCSNDAELQIMKDRKVDAELVNINMCINVPSDIPKAQNACVKYCFEAGADYVIYTMGDQYLTHAGDAYIKERIDTLNDEANCCMPAMNVQLYTNMWTHYWQLSISTKLHKIEYNEQGDGEATIHKWPTYTDRIDLLLDIGYLGTEAYYKHIRNHALIWKKPDPHYDYKLQWIKLYETGHLKEAVKLGYNAIKKSKGVNLEPINVNLYTNLLDKLNLWDDYTFCNEVRQSL